MCFTTGSQEVHYLAETKEENKELICSNQEQQQKEDWEARRAKIKLTKGFVAKESVKGHMASSFFFFLIILIIFNRIDIYLLITSIRYICT